MVASSGAEAVANGRKITSGMSGMCQKFVRDPCWKAPSLYGSAIQAWNGARLKHPGDRNPPVGAPVYYRGGQYGHAVIYVGNGRIRSTDCTTRNAISEVALNWPETAWGYQYLGWTGDINGVTLPLETGGPGIEDVDDMPLTDAEIDKIAKAVWKYRLKNYDDKDDAEDNRAEVMLAQTHARAGDARRAASKAANQ